MKTPYFFSRKQLLTLSYITFILAGMTSQTFALNSIFTTTEPQGNVAATQSVTTFTVAVAGLDTNSLVLDGCTISFTDFGTGDTDCTDGVGTIDSIVNSSMAQQATVLAGFTFTNYTASAGISGEFILTHTGAPIDGNTSSSEIGTVSVSDIVTTPGVGTAIAQVVSFIPLSPTLGETYQVFINGSGSTYTVSSTGTTIQEVVESLQPVLNAYPAVSCTEDNIQITCTADISGVGFGYSTMVVDITAATVVLTSSAASPTNGAFTITATYSEDVMGITDAGFTVSNAILSDFTGVSASVYTILVTPIADGIVTIDMIDSAGYDTGGNDTLGAVQLVITYDIVVPTVVLTTPLSPTNAVFTVRATFSEPVTGVNIGDFVIAGGTASGFTVLSPTIYRITVIPLADGIVTINMTGGVATDIATNGNTGATQLSVIYDSALPTVILTSSPAAYVNGDFTVTAQFSELVTGFDNTDIIISNGTKGTFTAVDGDTYTLVVTPTVEGLVTADVAGAAAIDSTSNDSIVATQLAVIFDVTAPVLTLVGSGSQTIDHGSLYGDLGATWTDAVDGSGTLATASSGSVDTMTLGVYTLEYAYTDAASNTGNTVTRTVTVADQTAPILTLVGSGTQSIEQGSVYTDLGATWTDAVDGSGALPIASSGTVDTSFTGTYILEYTYTDAASNTGNIVTRTVIVADTTAPVVTLMGLPTVVLLYGDTYVESGATWTDTVDGSGVILSASSGSVDTMTLGTYILEYSYTDVASNISSMVTRMVIITDGVSPVITLSGALSLTIAHGSVYSDPGALWTDDVDGSGVVLSASSGSVNTALVGMYTLEYTHIDTSSNTGNTVTRTVTVTDQTPPVVTLIGLGSQVINQGSLYTDPGAIWIDAVDGSGTLAMASSGTVDTTFTGTYVLEYTYTDAASNTGTTVTRIVTVVVTPIVVVPPSGGTSGGGGGGGGGSSYSSSVVMASVALMNSGTLTTIAPVKTKTVRKIFKPRTLSGSTLSVFGEVSLGSAPSVIVKKTQSPTPSSAGTIFQVIEKKINVRLAAASDAKILGYLTSGNMITALLEENNWVQFRFGMLKGWVRKSLLKSTETPLASAPDITPSADIVSAPVFFVNVPRLNIREQPTAISPTYHSLVGGQDVQITGRYGDWVNIRISSDESRGWVKSIYLTERQ